MSGNEGIKRRDLIRWLALTAGATAAGLYLPGCGSAGGPAATPGAGAAKGAAAGSAPPQPLRWSYKTDFFNGNPWLHSDATSAIVQEQWFESLLWLDTKGQYLPKLAESWQEVDSQNIRFKLRRGVKFHNGEPLDAESFRFSLQFIKDPANKSAQAATHAAVKEIIVEDPYTLVVRTTEPYAPILSILVRLWALPPKHIQNVGWEAYAKKPIGTGPYKFVEWVKDVRLVTEPNPEYWGGTPKLGQITYRPTPEDSTRVAALLNKEVDFISAFPIERVAEIQKNPDFKTYVIPGQMIYMGLDTLRVEPFKSKKVRQALNYAINVDAIVKNMLLGAATRLNGPLHVQAPGYDPNLAPFPFDQDKARQLLKEGGYGDGFSFRLHVAKGYQGAMKLDEVAMAMQADLAKVGIKAELEIMEPAASFELYSARKLQAYIYPWGLNPITGQHTFTLLHSKTRGYYYQNPDADKVVERYMQTIDPAARVPIGKELVNFLRDDAPWVYLYQEPFTYAMHKSVQWEPNNYDTLLRFFTIGRTA